MFQHLIMFSLSYLKSHISNFYMYDNNADVNWHTLLPSFRPFLNHCAMQCAFVHFEFLLWCLLSVSTPWVIFESHFGSTLNMVDVSFPFFFSFFCFIPLLTAYSDAQNYTEHSNIKHKMLRPLGIIHMQMTFPLHPVQPLPFVILFQFGAFLRHILFLSCMIITCVAILLYVLANFPLFYSSNRRVKTFYDRNNETRGKKTLPWIIENCAIFRFIVFYKHMDMYTEYGCPVVMQACVNFKSEKPSEESFKRDNWQSEYKCV